MGLFDLYQHSQIRKTRNRVKLNEDTNEHRHRRSRDDLMDVQERIDSLMLVNEAIWELVVSRTDLTDDDLRAKLEALDLSDGSADGRRRASPASCSCGAKIGAQAQRCVFCGLDAPVRSPFDTI